MLCSQSCLSSSFRYCLKKPIAGLRLNEVLLAEREEEVLIIAVIVDLDGLAIDGTHEILARAAVIALEIEPLDLHLDRSSFRGMEKGDFIALDGSHYLAAVIFYPDIDIVEVDPSGHLNCFVFTMIGQGRIAPFVDKTAGDVRYADFRIGFHSLPPREFPIHKKGL